MSAGTYYAELDAALRIMSSGNSGYAAQRGHRRSCMKEIVRAAEIGPIGKDAALSRQHDLITQTMTITRQVQAERVNNLVVMSQLLSGSPMRFADLAEFMKATRNATIARSTWHLLRSAEHKVVKLDFLTGVASFFGVDERFLAWDDAEASPDYVRLRPEIENIRVAEITGAVLSLIATLPSHLHEEVLLDLKEHLSVAEKNQNI